MIHRTSTLALALSLCSIPLAVGCGPEDPPVAINQWEFPGWPTQPGGDRPDEGLPILGRGTHSLDHVVLTEIGTASDGLTTPRDLAFNPERPSELWVMNRDDHSAVIYTDVDDPDASVLRKTSPSAEHFMRWPSGLAFGAPGTVATIQESDVPTQGGLTPGDFMGPSLFTTNLDIFDGGHGSHYDMLHNSPLGMGIAWERDNIFWVFDGYHESITRYDFNEDHGLGGTDHSDGIVTRYVEAQVAHVPGVPAHMAIDRDANLLYFTDAGNQRIAVLDMLSGSSGADLYPNYDGGEQYRMYGADLWTLTTGSGVSLDSPSGLEIRDGMLFVSDCETSRILAFSLTGELIDWLDTGYPPGTLMGLAFDKNGRLYLVDAESHRILRIAPTDD